MKTSQLQYAAFSLVLVLAAARIRRTNGATGAENQVRHIGSSWDICSHLTPTKSSYSAAEGHTCPLACETAKQKECTRGADCQTSVSNPPPKHFSPLK